MLFLFAQSTGRLCKPRPHLHQRNNVLSTLYLSQQLAHVEESGRGHRVLKIRRRKHYRDQLAEYESGQRRVPPPALHSQPGLSGQLQLTPEHLGSVQGVELGQLEERSREKGIQLCVLGEALRTKLSAENCTVTYGLELTWP